MGADHRLGASYCRYNVCIEHTLVLGQLDPRQQAQHEVACEAMRQVLDAARPGRELGTLDDIHRKVLDAAGFGQERFSACGYALGCTYRPTWMDVPPMIYSGNPLVMEADMVFFVHIMIPDTRTGLAAGVGQTFALRENGPPEVFSTIPLALLQG